MRELTPRGTGAVSVVEFSGAGASEHVRALANLERLDVGDVRLARVHLAGDVADSALVVCRAVDRVEVHVHGSPALVRAACAESTTDARGGETTLEDRALAALAGAPCEAAARILLDQAEGALRQDLERLVTLGDAPLRAAASELAERGRRARFALEPARIVLAGPVNAGKSTLFNVLAGVERAIVADLPGTTRDVLVAEAMLGAWPVRLYDTAGERELASDTAGRSASEDGARAIEAEGQRRARLVRESADLVLWLARADSSNPVMVPAAAVRVWTQGDRLAHAPVDALRAISDPRGARAHVTAILRARFDLPVEPWEPGVGVPFERELVGALDAVARGEGDARALAERWLHRA